MTTERSHPQPSAPSVAKTEAGSLTAPVPSPAAPVVNTPQHITLAQEVQILREANDAMRGLKAERDRLAALNKELVEALRAAEPYVDQRAAMTDDPKPRQVHAQMIGAIKAAS